MLHGKFYEGDVLDWDIVISYDFVVIYLAGALPHRATIIREASERLSWLSTHYALRRSQWTGEEVEKIVRAVKAAEIKSKGSNGAHLQGYGLSRDAYCRMIEAFGM